MPSLPRIEQSSATLASPLSQIRLVYTDLDGTLLGPGGSVFRDAQGELTLEPARALLEAIEAGLEMVPVSGRNKFQLLDDVRMLGLQDFIAEAGCLIVHDRNVESPWACTGTFPAVDGTIHDAVVASGADRLLFEAFPRALEPHTPWTGMRECSLLLRGNVDLAAAQRVLDGSSEAQLPLRLIDNGIIHPRHHTLLGVDEVHAYHLLPEESSKPAAVRRDLQLRHAGKHEAIAIGDSLSDLEIASEVGVFFLVANALDDDGVVVRAREHDNVFVTSGEMGLGWAEAVRVVIAATAGR